MHHKHRLLNLCILLKIFLPKVGSATDLHPRNPNRWTSRKTQGAHAFTYNTLLHLHTNLKHTQKRMRSRVHACACAYICTYTMRICMHTLTQCICTHINCAYAHTDTQCAYAHTETHTHTHTHTSLPDHLPPIPLGFLL